MNSTGDWPADRAWFVEAKIADKAHGLNLYGKHGIRRFVDGEYAWAMPSALMLCYAGDGWKAAIELDQWLNHSDTKAKFKNRSKAMRDPDLTGKTAEVWRSEHDRDGLYASATHGPGPLTLHHIWLQL